MCPIAVGLYSIRFVHDRRFGLLLIGAGLAWSLTALGASPDSLPYSIGRVSAWLIFPLLVYLMLAFPEGRLAAGWPRVLFGSITGLIVALYVGSALFVDAYPTAHPVGLLQRRLPAQRVHGGRPANRRSWTTS